MDNCIIENSDFSDAQMGHHFCSSIMDSVIRNCVFNRADMAYSNICDCVVEESEFIDCIFSGMSFDNKTTNTDFTGVQSFFGQTGFGGEYYNCKFNNFYCFANQEWCESLFKKCEMKDMRVIGAELYGVSFEDCILTGTQFQYSKFYLDNVFISCNLEKVSFDMLEGFFQFIKCNLKEAKLYGECAFFNKEDFVDNVVTNASIGGLYPMPDRPMDEIDLENCDFENVDANGIIWKNANLKGINLANSNLRDADLEGADLTGANLEGANLEGVRLNHAIFFNARLEGVRILDKDYQFIKEFISKDKIHVC